MNFLKLLLVINFIGICWAASGDKYWQEFMDARGTSPKLTVVQHLGNLSTKVDGDTETTLKRKSNAILYFVTTGGKWGFSNKIADDTDRKVITDALIFATLADTQLSNTTLGTIRDRYVSGIADKPIQTHLLEAQRIITGSLVMGIYIEAGIEAQTTHQTPNFNKVTALFNDLFIEPYKHYHSKQRISFQEWSFARNYFLRLLNEKFHTSLFISLNEYYGYNAHQFDPTSIQFTEQMAEGIRQQIAFYCSYKPQLTHLKESERNLLADNMTDYVEETKSDFTVKAITDGRTVFIYPLVQYGSLSRNTQTPTYSNVLSYTINGVVPTDYNPPVIPAGLSLTDLVHHLLYAAVYEPPHSW